MITTIISIAIPALFFAFVSWRKYKNRPKYPPKQWEKKNLDTRSKEELEQEGLKYRGMGQITGM